MRKRFVLPCFAAVLALGGCFLDSAGGGSSISSADGTGNGISGAWDTTYSIPVVQLTSGTIVNSYPLRISSYCSGVASSPAISAGGTTAPATPASWSWSLAYDTSKAHLDTAFYELHGNSLWVRGGDTSRVGIAGKAFRYSIYTRASGSGVVGTWNLSYRDTIVPLNIPETDSALKAKRAAIASTGAAMMAVGAASAIEISATAVVVHSKDGNWAMLLLADWDSYDADTHAVTAKVVDANTITFTAGDTVATKTRLDRNRVQVSSNAPTTYPTYIDYRRPSEASQCAEEWFWTFLDRHGKSKASGRTAAAAPSAAPQGHRF